MNSVVIDLFSTIFTNAQITDASRMQFNTVAQHNTIFTIKILSLKIIFNNYHFTIFHKPKTQQCAYAKLGRYEASLFGWMSVTNGKV